MADVIVTQDPTKPGVNKLNGPPIVNGKVPLTSLSTTGANPNDVITLQGGNWTPVPQAGVESASNLGAGSQVFKSKVGTDFQFRSFIGTGGITVTQNANDITITSAAGIITKSFTSAEQGITLFGPLTLAHGMAASPKILQFIAVCKSAELNYSINDQTPYPNEAEHSASYGLAVTWDATNIYIRYADGTPQLNDKTSGAATGITIGSWRLVVVAFA